MSRYFLHLCEHSASVFDDEGIYADDEAAAVERAVTVIRDVIANDILSGQTVALGSYVLIQDENGNEVRRVFFREAVRFLEESDGDAASFPPD